MPLTQVNTNKNGSPVSLSKDSRHAFFNMSVSNYIPWCMIEESYFKRTLKLITKRYNGTN